MKHFQLNYSNPVEVNGVIFQSVVQSKIFIPIITTRVPFKLGINVTNKTRTILCFTRDVYPPLSSKNFCELIDGKGNLVKSSIDPVGILRLEGELSYLVPSQETIFLPLENLLYKKIDEVRIDIRYRQSDFLSFNNLKPGKYKIRLSCKFTDYVPREYIRKKDSLEPWSSLVNLPPVEFEIGYSNNFYKTIGSSKILTLLINVPLLILNSCIVIFIYSYFYIPCFFVFVLSLPLYLSAYIYRKIRQR